MMPRVPERRPGPSASARITESIPIDRGKWPINRNWVTGRAVVDRGAVHVHDLPSEGDDFPEGRELRATRAIERPERTFAARG